MATHEAVNNEIPVPEKRWDDRMVADERALLDSKRDFQFKLQKDMGFRVTDEIRAEDWRLLADEDQTWKAELIDQLMNREMAKRIASHDGHLPPKAKVEYLWARGAWVPKSPSSFGLLWFKRDIVYQEDGITIFSKITLPQPKVDKPAPEGAN